MRHPEPMQAPHMQRTDSCSQGTAARSHVALRKARPWPATPMQCTYKPHTAPPLSYVQYLFCSVQMFGDGRAGGVSSRAQPTHTLPLLTYRSMLTQPHPTVSPSHHLTISPLLPVPSKPAPRHYHLPPFKTTACRSSHSAIQPPAPPPTLPQPPRATALQTRSKARHPHTNTHLAHTNHLGGSFGRQRHPPTQTHTHTSSLGLFASPSPCPSLFHPNTHARTHPSPCCTAQMTRCSQRVMRGVR